MNVKKKVGKKKFILILLLTTLAQYAWLFPNIILFDRKVGTGTITSSPRTPSFVWAFCFSR